MRYTPDMDIIVNKRNGGTEPFDIKKIVRVMGAAGLDTEQTNEVVKKIHSWIKSLNLKEVTSIQIRDHLLNILPDIDKQSADLFTWYEKTKPTF